VNYDEAAAIPGLPVGTIHSRLARGRQTLRKTFNFETRVAKPRFRPPLSSDGMAASAGCGMSRNNGVNDPKVRKQKTAATRLTSWVRAPAAIAKLRSL